MITLTNTPAGAGANAILSAVILSTRSLHWMTTVFFLPQLAIRFFNSMSQIWCLSDTISHIDYLVVASPYQFTNVLKNPVEITLVAFMNVL